MKKYVVFFLSILLCLSLVACGTSSNDSGNTASDSSSWKAGTYTASAKGMNGDVKVEVVLDESSIKSVKVLEHQESEGISDPAIEKIPQQIVDAQGLGIDTVSGASFTSKAILEAVTIALKEAGADVDALKKIKGDSSTANKDIETAYDVVVIGGGGAGLTSAITAAENGAKVVVLEKMPAVGGNTLISGGEMAAPGNWLQEKEGIEDSTDLFYEDILKGGDNESDPALIRVIADNALNEAIWLKDEVGVVWEDYMLFFGGHSVKRSLVPKNASGVELITKLEAKAKEMGITILTDTKASALIANSDDKETINAVEAEMNGDTVIFTAAKGVVLASGGFGANIDMRVKYNPEMDDKILSTTSAGSTGDGIVMAEAIGAQLDDMSFIQTYPTCDPETGRLLYVGDVRLEGRSILVNKEGKRFVEELERRDVISKATTETSDGYSYMFWDQASMVASKVDVKHKHEYDSLIDRGLLVKADTIDEAAKHFGIDAEALKETVKNYNEYAKNGKDLEFNKRGELVAFTDGPYYIMKSIPAVHHTMGGVKINPDAQVINTTGDIIKGLYAAGEVTGNIHGTNRLGSDAIADIIVFGRVAGKNAAEGK
ncbi:flavocytochrome c [Bacillus tuaregi]|uniref:flavocytochrome c n=1 Tax=Bacillus tuaregi TaxID=1816695 RepID=UPI0008F84487|nr:flavocytochrome c [Bacillus tuaregi]